MTQTLTQGQNFTDTAGRTGIVNFDVNTGKRLGTGQTTILNRPSIAQNQAITPSVLKPTPTSNIPTRTLTVSGYTDNSDGTTTNTLSDGSKSTVRYTPNADGSLTPTEIPDYATSQLDFLKTQQTDNQKFQENTIYDFLKGSESLLGESAMLQQQQEQQGVLAKEAEYRKISDQIRTRQAQTAQEFAAINKSPMSFSARSGYEAAVRAANDSEVGALNAQAQAVAGEYDMAVKTAQNAVDAKYKPIKERLEIQKLQLLAIEPLIKADEKKQLDEQNRLIKLEERQYNEKVAFEKDLATMTITALAAGAPQSVIDASKNAKTTLEAAQILGRYSPETLKYEMLKEQIKTEKAQQANIYNTISARNADTARQNAVAAGTGNLKQEDVAKALESKTGVRAAARKDLLTQLSSLDALYTQYGARPTSPEGIGAIASARSAAQLAIATANGQGAISDGDRKSYDAIVGTTFGVAPTAKLKQTIKTQQSAYDNDIQLLNTAYPGIDKVDYFTKTTVTAPNKFEQATGTTLKPFPGTGSINGFNKDGTINFKLQ